MRVLRVLERVKEVVILSWIYKEPFLSNDFMTTMVCFDYLGVALRSVVRGFPLSFNFFIFFGVLR